VRLNLRGVSQKDGGVTGYRLYYLDKEGHIRAAAEFLCATDDDARHSAEDLQDGRATELWCGARVVEKYPAHP
jgi:hypothetical protein